MNREGFRTQNPISEVKDVKKTALIVRNNSIKDFSKFTRISQFFLENSFELKKFHGKDFQKI